MQKLIREMDANCRRIQEIANVCEAESRTRNEAEEREYRELQRRNSYIEMKLAATRGRMQTSTGNTLTRSIREMLNSGVPRKMEFIYRRAEGDAPASGGTGTESGSETATLTYTGVSDVQDGGAEPIRIADVIKPLYEGLILDKVGIDMRTGLSGEYVWPVVEAVTVKVAGEAVKLASQKISMDKVKARPERIGASLSLTRQSVIQSEGLVEALATQLMPEALAAGINQIMFSVDKVLDTTDNLVGPFVALKSKAKNLSLKTATLKDFTQMKADVLKKGIPGRSLCFVMSKSTAAILEGTPRDAGSGIMLIENGMLAGVPVFTTEAIGDYIGLGDWVYQVLGLFGDISFIADPYTSGDADMINYYLNANYGTATLRADAFVLAKGVTA